MGDQSEVECSPGGRQSNNDIDGRRGRPGEREISPNLVHQERGRGTLVTATIPGAHKFGLGSGSERRWGGADAIPSERDQDLMGVKTGSPQDALILGIN